MSSTRDVAVSADHLVKNALGHGRGLDLDHQLGAACEIPGEVAVAVGVVALRSSTDNSMIGRMSGKRVRLNTVGPSVLEAEAEAEAESEAEAVAELLQLQ